MNKNIILVISIIAFTNLHAQDNAEAGKKIFTTKCASCHNFKQDMTGPALKDLDKRRKEDWIIQFVQSSQTLISSGDPEAKAIFAKYQTIMPDHKDLSSIDIKNIITYIKEESARIEKEAKNNPIKRPKERILDDIPLSFSKDWWVFVIYGFFLFLLVYTLKFVIDANELIKKFENKS